MVVKAQGEIDHGFGFGNHLSSPTETSQIVADVAAHLLDGKRQVFAGEELVFRDVAMETFLSRRSRRCDLRGRFWREISDRLHHHAHPEAREEFAAG
jgi:hypothetical protein